MSRIIKRTIFMPAPGSSPQARPSPWMPTKRAKRSPPFSRDIGLDPRTGATIHQAFPGHYMIYAPGVTGADLGYAADAAKADRSLPFIFEGGAGGSDLAYLITVPHAH